MTGFRHFLPLVLLQGCAALSSGQAADTVGAGRLQLGVEPGVAVGFQSGDPSFSPSPDLSLRFGASDRLDFGGRIGASGLEVQAKFMVTPRWSKFIVSLAPSLAGLPRFSEALDLDGLTVNAALPLLLGLRLGPHQLVLGPRVHLFAATGSEPRRFWAAGGSFGVVVNISRAVAVLPEFALVVPLGGTGDGGQDSFTRLSSGLWGQARLGFLIGESQR